MHGTTWPSFFSLEIEKLRKKIPLTYLQDARKYRIRFQWDSEILPKICSIIAQNPWPGLCSNKEKKRKPYPVSGRLSIRLLALTS